MRKLIVALVVAALTLAGVTVVSAAATSTDVACTITENTLSCPLPAPPAPVTVTETTTATETLTPQPATVTTTVTTTATVTATPAPATSTAATTSPATTTSTAAPAAPTGFPDASNTGVPAGVTLTPYTGPCSITVPTTIDGKTVNCNLILFADVTIIRSKVNGQVKIDTDRAGSGAWRLTLTDSEVDAGLMQEAAVCCGNMSVTRANIHGGQTAAQCEETSYYCVITDSWLHGQRMPADQDWHLGGFLSDGTRGSCTGNGGMCIELTHNTVACDAPVNAVDGGCTGDINFIPNFATASKIVVRGNLLRASMGLSYCTYGGEKSTSQYPHGDHITYIDNVFERGSNGKCGHYGPVTGFNSSGAGNVWQGNTWADNGAAVTPAN